MGKARRTSQETQCCSEGCITKVCQGCVRGENKLKFREHGLLVRRRAQYSAGEKCKCKCGRHRSDPRGNGGERRAKCTHLDSGPFFNLLQRSLYCTLVSFPPLARATPSLGRKLWCQPLSRPKVCLGWWMGLGRTRADQWTNTSTRRAVLGGLGGDPGQFNSPAPESRGATCPNVKSSKEKKKKPEREGKEREKERRGIPKEGAGAAACSARTKRVRCRARGSCRQCVLVSEEVLPQRRQPRSDGEQTAHAAEWEPGRALVWQGWVVRDGGRLERLHNKSGQPICGRRRGGGDFVEGVRYGIVVSVRSMAGG